MTKQPKPSLSDAIRVYAVEEGAARAGELLESDIEVPARQKEEDWQALLARAASEGLDLENAAPEEPALAITAAASKPRRLVLALAAGWILTALGAGFWIHRLTTTREGGSSSLASQGLDLETNVLTKTLRPGENRLRAESEPVLLIGGTTDRVTLFLLNDDPGPYTRYHLELRDPHANLLFEVPDLHRAEDGSFVVSFDPAPLAAGRHEWIVTGHDGDDSRILGRYPLVVESAAEP